MDVETASEFSEQSSIQTPLYTCLTCKVAFRTSDIQREHYRQDWHRYNLKRKVAGLQPISHDLFKEKIAGIFFFFFFFPLLFFFLYLKYIL